jgi:polysaccharide biosynthesis protein PslH
MRILFLTSRLPWPPAGGDKLLVYHHIRLIAPHAGHIHVLSLVDNEADRENAAAFEKEFENLTVETVLLPSWQSWLRTLKGLLFSSAPLQVHYYHCPAYSRRLRQLAREQEFDACYLHLIRMLPYARHLPDDVRTVLSMTDCLTLRYERSLPYTRGKARLIDRVELRRVPAYEAAAVKQTGAAIVVTENDRDKLIELGADPAIRVVRNGVDFSFFHPDPGRASSGCRISFLGNLHSTPNRDAVRYLIREIWPLVRADAPQAELQIIGINPTPWMLEENGRNGVTVTGAVDDVRPWLWKSAVSVCPMRIGAGVQNKILESLALGVPVIASPVGFEGLGAGADDGVLVAEDAEAFAAAILRVLGDAALRADLAREGRNFVEQHYSWEEQGGKLRNILKGAGKEDGAS